ncbi:MAG: 6-carboxytetrahydropterin synthase [Planctomycetota bacterium]|nr:6-carboxytetrahydropterin synthase [Planctomycetota bacterium]
MFRLSREVRFAVNPDEDDQLAGPPTNSFAGFPSLRGIGHFLSLEVTLAAANLDARSACLRNIKEIDQVVRQQAIPLATAFVRRGRYGGGSQLLLKLFEVLRNAWPESLLHHLRLSLSPLMTLTVFAREYPMVRISQKFEFSASHRLYNPALSEEQNAEMFGKCTNVHGHGHNYVLQVTLAGPPNANGLIIDIPKFEKIVASTVIEKFDHKNINAQLPEFAQLIPTVENIASVIYRLLKPAFETTEAKLAGVTVWETPKTWCEYME